MISLEKLSMVGIDHNAPLEIREQTGFGFGTKDALKELKKLEKIDEAVIISTCQRNEILYISSEEDQTVIQNFFSNFFKISPGKLAPFFYVLKGIEVVEHIFRLTCGLESMVMGEPQILGQVKKAWDLAREQETTGLFLNRLLRDGVTCGKKARTQTGINAYPVSISTIAVHFLEEELGNLADKKAFIIGSGEVGYLTIKHLFDRGIGKIWVSNRTDSIKKNLKYLFPRVSFVSFDSKYQYISKCDILISATTAPHYTVNLDKFSLNYYGNKMYILDLGFPRNIDPKISVYPQVSLFNLDNLKSISEENRIKRKNYADLVEIMVKQATERFLKWHKSLEIVPLICKNKEFVFKTCWYEYEKLSKKINGIDDAEREKIRQAIERTGIKISKKYFLRLKLLEERDELNPQVLNKFQEVDK